MSTLIMWHNRFSENENENQKATTSRFQGQKTAKLRNGDN